MKARVMSGAVAMAATVVLGVGAAPAGAVPGAGPGAEGAEEAEHWLRAKGEFGPVGETGEVPVAVTYDEALVPAGAHVRVGQRVTGDRMVIDLFVGGLVPGRTYGAHVHTAPCGADPASSGPHYQNVPGVATEENEVWLDFTAGGEGAGSAVAGKGWVFREGEAASVVVHEHATGHGGVAGDRLACFTVPFAGAAQG
ncbi:superoxide dismutase family protein [Streptomyces avicenniae]|uniref:superoxide dismutase family protein n=1 Tax=Streptomyces avicenniae TaxID=500153 RepID=UPI000B22EC05|nr:superoxide dismutase family protein [Streptomyces avicenniae]